MIANRADRCGRARGTSFLYVFSLPPYKQRSDIVSPTDSIFCKMGTSDSLRALVGLSIGLSADVEALCDTAYSYMTQRYTYFLVTGGWQLPNFDKDCTKTEADLQLEPPVNDPKAHSIHEFRLYGRAETN